MPTLFEKQRLLHYQGTLGFMSAEAALSRALAVEQTARRVALSPVLRDRLTRQQQAFEEYALLLEKAS